MVEAWGLVPAEKRQQKLCSQLSAYQRSRTRFYLALRCRRARAARRPGRRPVVPRSRAPLCLLPAVLGTRPWFFAFLVLGEKVGAALCT